MSKTTKTKLKRKAITLETKIEILDRLRNGEGSTFLGKMFGLNEATVRTIKKNEISIRQSVISGTKLSVKSSSYTRDATKEKMEKALIIWLEDNAQKRIPVDGNNIKQPLLINRALKPRAMKGVNFDTLPVNWMANKKAWVTTTVFTEWFIKYFVPETRKYMNEKGLEFKVLLLVDNAPGHPQLEHENVQVLFLPPNTTSLIQPLDQGIIATFKTYYIKRTFQYILDTLDKDKALTVIDAWKKFNIKDCGTHAALALSGLRPSTLNACWRLIWPECVKSKNHVDPNTNEYRNIISLAHTVGGEGFDDLVFDDIDELLVDKVLSEDEILHFAITQNADAIESSDSEEPVKLTANLIQEGLQLANKLGYHFVTNDPNVERAAQFQRELNSCMARYKELYKEVATIGEQRLITEFTVKNVDSERARESPVQNYSSDDSDFIRIRCKRMRVTDDDSIKFMFLYL